MYEVNQNYDGHSNINSKSSRPTEIWFQKLDKLICQLPTPTILADLTLPYLTPEYLVHTYCTYILITWKLRILSSIGVLLSLIHILFNDYCNILHLHSVVLASKYLYEYCKQYMNSQTEIFQTWWWAVKLESTNRSVLITMQFLFVIITQLIQLT